MILLDGKKLAEKIRGELKTEIKRFVERNRRPPGLGVILVGDHEASGVYVGKKMKACAELGIDSTDIRIPATSNESQVLAEVEKLNQNPKVDGILVQLPLPEKIDTGHVLERIRLEKDVDGFHPVNVGRLVQGSPGMIPCTPLGILRLLDEYRIQTEGVESVVVGRSSTVGQPMASLLLARHATVTICHSRTKNLPEICRRADILVAAVGRAEMIRADWVKPGATVVDVGINRRADGTLVGDVAFEEVKKMAGAITPVPGGVGPLTIAMLMTNTLTAAKRMEPSA